jgi:hypothetical protein
MQWQWSESIPCRDFAGREKFTHVGVTHDGRVAFVAPAGEAATWHPADVLRVQEALRTALSVVGQDGGAR